MDLVDANAGSVLNNADVCVPTKFAQAIPHTPVSSQVRFNSAFGQVNLACTGMLVRVVAELLSPTTLSVCLVSEQYLLPAIQMHLTV